MWLLVITICEAKTNKQKKPHTIKSKIKPTTAANTVGTEVLFPPVGI